MPDTPIIIESSGPPAIAPAPTSIALFIGWAPSGPTDKAVGVSSFAEYESAFGQLDDVRSLLGYALGHFFDNGGKNAQVLRIVGANGEAIVPADHAFVQALTAACGAGGPVDKVDIFNLICIPGLADAAAIAMLQVKAAARHAFLIADCAESATVASVSASLAALTGANAASSALYFPWVLAPDQLRDNVSRAFPPCGFVAGIYARTDATRGVWKEPAGTEASLAGAKGMIVVVGNADQDQLNPRGVNCLRQLSDTVVVVWGARTLASSNASVSDWIYVPVRRLALFIEDSLYAGTKWAVFEPNGETLWAKLRASIDAFLLGQWRSGALVGSTASQAWFVKCDGTTTTQADIDRGVVNIMVGFAPLKPAEFVIITIAQLAAAR
jgi:hypothetical protein